MADIDVLFPGKTMTVGGLSLTVVPFSFGKMPEVTQLLQPILKPLSASGIINFSDKGIFSISPTWPAKIIDIMADAGEPLLKLVSFLADVPRETLDTFGMDDGIDLTRAVIEINADFFIKKVLPRLGLVLAGAESLQDSSNQVTDDPISTDTPSDKSSST